MQNTLSLRLRQIVDALPLQEGIRVLEIGCGPGAAAREIASRINKGYVLGIDRSAKAIKQALDSSKNELASGKLSFRLAAIEELELNEAEEKFDFAFAVRVGALDGRHPELGKKAIAQIKKALKENGKLYIDGGDPLQSVPL